MTKNKENEKVVLEDDRNPIDVSNTDVKSAEDEKERKTDVQDRTTFQDNDHVQYNLDVDPNDPRNREPAHKLPSLDDKETQVPSDYHGQPGSHNGKQNTNPLI